MRRSALLTASGLLTLLGLPGLAGCQKHTEGENFLIILSDDVGIDKTAAYGEHPTAPPTPAIDALAAEGLLFRNAYSCPTCTPSRAAILTGRLPSRTGLGRWLNPDQEENELRLAELTIPEMLRHSATRYTSGLAGKWHLVGFLRDAPRLHPLEQGFEVVRGSLANLENSVYRPTGELGNFLWEKDTDGNLGWCREYSATDTTDEALDFILEAKDPFFLLVSYNLAHVPVEVPPDPLNLAGVDDDSSELEKFHASVMALDAEIGRLMAGIPKEIRDNTTIIYLSDNGTDRDWIEPPGDVNNGKATVMDSGVRVPFIVLGPHVRAPGTETTALVHIADIYATIAEIAGVDTTTLVGEEGESEGQTIAIDGVSFLGVLEQPGDPGLRQTVTTEGYYPNGVGTPDYHQRMIRDGEWKLRRFEEFGELSDLSLYHYDSSRFGEGPDLLTTELSPEASEAYARLSAELDAQIADMHYEF